QPGSVARGPSPGRSLHPHPTLRRWGLSVTDIPRFLLEQSRWVLWREVTREGKKTKLPLTIKNTAASATRLGDWTDYHAVAAVFARNAAVFDGTGIVLGQLDKGEFLVGIDFDSCLHDGELTAWAVPFLAALVTYAEISPSGIGIKMFFRITAAD